MAGVLNCSMVPGRIHPGQQEDLEPVTHLLSPCLTSVDLV